MFKLSTREIELLIDELIIQVSEDKEVKRSRKDRRLARTGEDPWSLEEEDDEVSFNLDRLSPQVKRTGPSNLDRLSPQVKRTSSLQPRQIIPPGKED